MKQYAKGYRQELIISDLMEYSESAELKYYMKSQNRYSSYCESFRNLFSRLSAAGYPVVWQDGKHGGDWTARIILN